MIPYGNIGAVDFFPGVSLRSTTRLNADDALRATCRHTAGGIPAARTLPGILLLFIHD